MDDTEQTIYSILLYRINYMYFIFTLYHEKIDI